MTGSHNHSSEAPNLSQNLSQGRDGREPAHRRCSCGHAWDDHSKTGLKQQDWEWPCEIDRCVCRFYEPTSAVRENILAYLRERPGATVREVGEAVGLRSSSSSWEQLGTLERKGFIKRENCPHCDAKIWRLVKGVVK